MNDNCDAELEALRENFQNFTYTVSHDLNAPIRSVASFARLLEQNAGPNLDEKSKRYLEFIVSGAEKAHAMLSGLLDYSRLNTRPRKPISVDTKKVVHSCLAELRNTIEATSANVHVDTLPELQGDSNQLHQLFLSIIDNALKFHKPDTVPEIHIHAERADNGWRFWVEDNGIGIEPRFNEEIFNMYRRLHRESEYPGVGIGLALAKKIVELQGGVIGVNSVPGLSSAFYFILPDTETPGLRQSSHVEALSA